MTTLALVLAVALSSGQVAGVCAAGRVCNATAYRSTSNLSAPTAQFCESNNTNAFSLVRSANTASFQWSATCSSGGTAFPLSFNATSGVVDIGSSTALTFTGYSLPTSLPAPTFRGLAYDFTTFRLWKADSAVWTDVGTGQHDVFDGRSFTIAFAPATGAFAWKTAPRIGSTDLTVITETCATTAGEAQLSNAAGAFGTFTRTGRSCATSAVLNNVASVATPNVTGTVTAGSNNRFRMCAYYQISSVGNVRTVFGQLPAANFAAPTDTPTAMGAWFRFSTSAGDTNWMLCTSDSASAATCTSTGVAATAGSAVLLCVDKREQSAVTGWVNGQARVRVTTNLPLTGTGAAFGFATQTLSAAVVTPTSGPISLEVF